MPPPDDLDVNQVLFKGFATMSSKKGHKFLHINIMSMVIAMVSALRNAHASQEAVDEGCLVIVQTALAQNAVEAETAPIVAGEASTV